MCCFYFACFWGWISCNPGLPQTVAKNDVELLILLPSPLMRSWNYRPVPPSRFMPWRESNSRVLCWLGKHPTSWCTSQAPGNKICFFLFFNFYFFCFCFWDSFGNVICKLKTYKICSKYLVFDISGLFFFNVQWPLNRSVKWFFKSFSTAHISALEFWIALVNLLWSTMAWPELNPVLTFDSWTQTFHLPFQKFAECLLAFQDHYAPFAF